MTALRSSSGRRRPGARPASRIPFGTVDEVSRHCLTDEEPETVHIEVHLSGRPEPGRLRVAFNEALLRHPRILMREAPGRWYRWRYAWELTDAPDTDPVSFPPPGPDALAQARARALSACPPLTSSPPVRLEVITPGPVGGRHTGGRDGSSRDGIHRGDGARQGEGTHRGDGARQGDGTHGGDGACQKDGTHQGEVPHQGEGSVLLLTVNHTALDGPACLRVLATAAEIYGGAGNEPAPPPVRQSGADPRPEPDDRAPSASGQSAWARPARIARDTATRSTGNGMLIADLPVPPRPSRTAAPYTVNDQLLVATALMAARWNRLHDRSCGPIRITMPVDDRTRGAEMPIGNGTRLVEVPVTTGDRAELDLLSDERPDPAAVAQLLRRTARTTRALKAASRPPLGRGAALLTAPVLPVGLRASVTRALRRAAAPWTSTTLLSNIGRVPYPLDFGDAGRARAVWFSAPARMPRGLTVTTASTAGRLHLALRWSRALLDDEAAATLAGLFERALAATAAVPYGPDVSAGLTAGRPKPGARTPGNPS
ncbi:condensation protein [Streptomyces sp. NPDC051776]|uniref:condensation protein n=1 Tax=Streptomyces sp. NPDC051776 TaxID=3155414 RepID=UPI00341D8007